MTEDKKRSSRVSYGAFESEYSSSSLYSGFYKEYTFKFRDLRRFLSIVTNQIDLPAVALILAANEVIELNLAQELLQFTGGIREKGVKVLVIFNQLQRQEDRIQFFLKSLLESGESSPTNRDLYDRLSSELDFSDSDVEDACKNEIRRRSLSHRRTSKMKKTSGSSSSGIETSTSASSIRKFSSPQPYMSESIFSYDTPVTASPTHPSADSLTSLQVENTRLQEEVGRLHKMLEWSFNLLTETQKNLVTANSQLKVLYHTRPFEYEPVRSRRTSLHISPSNQGRVRKVSRSVDSIQHELMQLQLWERHEFPETTEPVAHHDQLPTAMLNQKSPRLHAKTAKGHK